MKTCNSKFGRSEKNPSDHRLANGCVTRHRISSAIRRKPSGSKHSSRRKQYAILIAKLNDLIKFTFIQ